MNNIVGPISAEDWSLMVDLKRSYKAYPKDTKYLRAINKEKQWYKDTLSKYLVA